MDKIPELKELMYSKMSDKNFADYVWETAIKPSLGYSFSINHSLPYSFVGIQEIELATRFSPVYWNTSCLCINAGTLEEKEGEFNDEEEDKKNKTVNYDKIARAIGEIRQANINIVPPLINSANKDFEPDVENNRILYSLKALSGVGDKEIEEIINKRPFNSLSDYLGRTKIKKTATISLIKSGAFDELEHKDRKEIMEDYIKVISEPKKVLNMRNFQALMRNDLFPEEAGLDYQCKLFEFNRYIRQKFFKKDDILLLDSRAQNFMLNNYPDFYDTAEIYDNNLLSIKEKAWKKVYDKDMLKAKEYIKENQECLLDNYNNLLFKDMWQQYAVGNISKWEMDSMSFYYHKHELADVNLNKYGISEFSRLPEEPEIERFFEIKGRQIPIYKIRKIIGTCIGKNPTRGSFTLLTSDGEVVDIKLTNEHFAYYNKQISEKNDDGIKKVKEKSWFTRGTKLMVVGIRRGNGFMAKKYKNTGGHRLYKITEVVNNGTEMLLSSSRYGAE